MHILKHRQVQKRMGNEGVCSRENMSPAISKISPSDGKETAVSVAAIVVTMV